MSIYATIFDIGEHHDAKCARKRRRKDANLQDCTCSGPPILYQGSHVMPSDGDKRGGSIMLSAIPSHITRDGRDDGPEGYWHPWLRLSTFELDSNSVLLTRKQAEELRDALSLWLADARVFW